MSKIRILMSQIFIVLFGSKSRLINDELFNRILFYLRTGKRANLNSPKTFNENVLARKVFCDEYALSVFTDKYEVRKYIEEKIGSEYLVPSIGIWRSVDEIDFDSLPESFVLKATHGSGWNVVVRNKSCFNKDKECKKLRKALSENYRSGYFRKPDGKQHDLCLSAGQYTARAGKRSDCGHLGNHHYPELE